MTNSEAIKILDNLKPGDYSNPYEKGEAIVMAISALEAQESSQNVTNGDFILRKAAIDALEKVADLFPYKVVGDADTYSQYNEAWNDAIGRAEMEIEKLPSAQPEIVRCKDCKFYSPMNKETKTGICNLTMHQNFGDDWFCAGAERRTDGV